MILRYFTNKIYSFKIMGIIRKILLRRLSYNVRSCSYGNLLPSYRCLKYVFFKKNRQKSKKETFYFCLYELITCQQIIVIP